MKLTLTEPRYIKDSIAIISDLVTEVNIKVTKDYMEIVAIDPANVAMVVYKLLSSAFSEYVVDGEKYLGVNLSNLNQVLRRVKATDMLTLELDEDKNRLNIRVKGTTLRNFDMALLDTGEEEQKVPALTYQSKVETNNLLLNESIEDMGVIADSLSFGLNDGKFIIDSEGTLSTGKVEISADEETDIQNPQAQEFKSKYSVEYLKKITKASKLTNSVILKFGQDYPLTMEYAVLDKLHLSFILAPRRVSND